MKARTVEPLTSRWHTLWIISALAATVLATGCVSSRTLQRQTARAAKDWCLVIRASQVIPVYPLTEDLVPGDIFLVQETREEQVRWYHKSGFLPLDHHLARLRPGNYAESYLRAHGADPGDRLPLTPSRSHAYAKTSLCEIPLRLARHRLATTQRPPFAATDRRHQRVRRSRSSVLRK